MTWIAIALGGALGSIARHAANHTVARLVGQPSALSTALVNIVGCAIIGALAGMLAAGSLRMSAPLRAFVFVGVLGGFTTFSSFGLDTLTLAHDGRTTAAATNVLAQVCLGLVAVFLSFNAFASPGSHPLQP
jgi:fluoride exporter